MVATLLAGCASAGGSHRARAPQVRPIVGGLHAVAGVRSIAGGLDAVPGVTQTEIGSGARAARVLIPHHHSEPAPPIVVFVHGWGPTRPFIYKSWLRHLGALGVIVIFPAYESVTSSPSMALSNMLAGIRGALAYLRADPASVVVAGHTTGATLALDYAGSAASAGLPPACAVYGVFPSIAVSETSGIVMMSPATLTPATRVVLVAGPGDPVPDGTGLARSIITGATRIPSSSRTLLSAPGGSPNGPTEDTPSSQRTYWTPLDRLIAHCRARRSGH
jgi:acetyl esterase/lipase